MTVSPDVIGVIIAGATLAAGLFGGIGTLVARQLGKLESRLEGRFDKLDDRLERIDGEISDLKVAVARLEGPTPRLIMPR
ncbi:hypothetical protein [Microbacterium sp. CPCC 204701]|uniref:hypothetical protein n=1 Tax=Microbacterium sp. CPCC 204701 TaxID=2493084 RepID=UPI000FD6D080|nr:hypothetical protein [Microbacterium sp. CPCC 204701]